MKHPFQHVLLDKTGDYFFAAAINSVFLFKFTSDGNDAKLLGSWTDEVDPYYTIRKHHRELLEQYEEQQREKAEKEASSSISNEQVNKNNKREINNQNQIPEEQIPSSTKQIMNKKPKLPLPGPGAPPTYTYIRDMCLSRNNKYLIVTTDNDKAVVVFDINYNAINNEEVFKLIKRQPMSKRPSAVSTSMDDSNIIIADKFGDVYSISMTDPVVEDDSKLIPILGHVSMLTCVQNSIDENGNEVIMTADRDEHIRISYFPKSYIIKKILFGHKEFISCFSLPEWCDGKVLISAGGDSFICSWLWQNKDEFSELKSKISIDSLVKDKLNDKHLIPEKFQSDEGNLVEYCISKIIPLNKSQQLVIIFERIPSLFVFDLTKDGELSFVKEYPVSNDIITATSSKDKLIISSDEMGQCLQFFTINDDKTLSISSHSDNLLKSIDNANNAVIGDIEELIPLFNINYLRKRREH
ncbi:tRNA (guanine-N(7)-)-methyltransferase non-catalytic subunit trm82 [Pichia californica]|uniref:tRNA (Guanine-N(7)-)-methyltransferase non-catalytic subunit trm82 n=1 Tax=Pichia californica TaxID=460514 RepID=A0A9P6WPQ0_9ASCO|nr:tRNA (guanine-N(7)-)-methyltransferase non-catalytic subunit trm82 [[Candida] californica]KAG0690007.1 tRNA (guanine-N(7)-)-methyltransferase non-catalytic subunit trm82 [[Candida] californica]